MNTDMIERKLNVIYFCLQKIPIGIDIKFIKKIIPLVEVKKIPQSPHYLAGLINLEGNSIFIIDLALFLGLERKKKYSLKTPIILCNSKTHQIGLIVDEIIGLESVEKNHLQMKGAFSQANSPFLASTLIKNKPTFLLNIKKILFFHSIKNISTENNLTKSGLKYE